MKITFEIDPEVIAENFSKSKMSRQTRALLINSLKAINPSAADGRSEHDLSFRIMSRMPQSNVGSLFSIQNLQNTEKVSHINQ